MKKIISILIIVSILCTSLFQVSFALSDYEKEVLSALSIVQGDPNGSMRYEESVSRAECAKIVVAASPYRDMVDKESKISPFKDVTFEHWASPYVATGIKYGLFKGYMDSTFRPSNTVLLEEAIVMFMRVLGYTDEDLGDDWPYSQTEAAKKAGLLNNVNKSTGQKLTRYDISTIAYNTLAACPKNSSITLLSTFNRTIGPKTVTSSLWFEEFGADSSIRVVRDGISATIEDVKTNDIVYFMEEYKIALVYSKKITGIYEDAIPSKNSPSSVVVSGVTYNLEGTNALSKLASGGTFKFGDSVTLLIGKDGSVADVSVSSASSGIGDKIYGLLTAVGTKETTVSGTKVTKPFVKIHLPSGQVHEYITDKNYESILNRVVSVKLENGVATLTQNMANHGISGKIVWGSGTNKIGSTNLSNDVKIIETSSVENFETASVLSVYPQRLNGLNISSSDILYASKDSNGNVDSMIIYNITGDANTYGVVTKAKNNSMDNNISGSYEYITNGTEGAFSTQNKTFGVSSGQAVQIKTNGREITSMTPLSKLSSDKITDIAGSNITVDGKTYTMSDRVQIYLKKQYSSTSYTLITMDEFIQMAEEHNASVYIDKPFSSGGRIRVIILS